jgi:HEAT repeat protein
MFRAGIAALVLLISCELGRAQLPAPAAPERLPMPRVFSEEAVISSLIEALGDTSFEVRSHLGAALAEYGPRAVPGLLQALQDKNAERRAGAAYAFSQMRPPDAEALPALLRAVKDPEEVVRREAAFAISRIVRYQQKAPETLPTPRAAPVPPLDPIPGASR